MKQQDVYIDQEVLFGTDCIFKRLLPKRVFLVRGKKSYKTCGSEVFFSSFFKKYGCRVTEYYEFEDNPQINDVVLGCELLSKSKADIIIACGGGSVLDMAKLIRFANAYNGDLLGKIFVKNKNCIPLIAVPTTAGTGAEATPFAVCYKEHIKYSVSHEDILPDYAIIYPAFTYKVSPYLTACTGFDALSQSIEAYWNINATEESDMYAEKAISSLWKNLPLAVHQPSPKVRQKIAEAAYWAGRSIAITKTTAPHAFSYAFTTYCGYPHGHAVALTFPFFMSLNLQEKYIDRLQTGINPQSYKDKMARLRIMLGITPEQEIQSAIECYISQLGLQNKGYKDYDIRLLLSQVNIQRLKNNPIIVDDIRRNELILYLEDKFWRTHE